MSRDPGHILQLRRPRLADRLLPDLRPVPAQGGLEVRHLHVPARQPRAHRIQLPHAAHGR